MIDEIRARQGKAHLDVTDDAVTERLEQLQQAFEEAMESADVLNRFEAITDFDSQIPITDFGKFVPGEGDDAIEIIRQMMEQAAARREEMLTKLATMDDGGDDFTATDLTLIIEQAALAGLQARIASVAGAETDELQKFWTDRLDAASAVWDWNAAITLSKGDMESHAYPSFIAPLTTDDAERMLKVATAITDEATIHNEAGHLINSQAVEIDRTMDEPSDAAYGAMMYEASTELRRAAILAVRANEYWGALAALSHKYPAIFGGTFNSPLADVQMGKINVDGFNSFKPEWNEGALAYRWRLADGEAEIDLMEADTLPEIVKGATAHEMAPEVAAIAYRFAVGGFVAGFKAEQISSFAKGMLGDKLADGWLTDCLATAKRDVDLRIGELILGVAKEGRALSEPMTDIEARQIALSAAGVDDGEGEGDPGSIDVGYVGLDGDDELPDLEDEEDFRPKQAAGPILKPSPSMLWRGGL